ncbi:HDLBP [Symbiodinium natans]|uniref:HDLBP protein n=1 Tax=Symbiodinium natans TaxID=878477 RepID=A0A812LYC0_9DINO|nr:HDLBP [Symbiodinium natans]
MPTEWCRGCWCTADQDSHFLQGYCSRCWQQWSEAQPRTRESNDRRCFRVDRVAIGELQFSQATISGSFKDGRPLDETVAVLRKNSDLVHKIPLINVVRHEGKFVSMDNRRLYTFRMAFDDDHEVPVRLFEDKAAYGAEDFDRKATSICGGHMVDVRDMDGMQEHLEHVELPQNAKSLVWGSLQQVKASTGARLRVFEDKVVISGSRRQVEEGIRSIQRILSTFASQSVLLHDYRAKEAVKRASATEWKWSHPSVCLQFAQSDEGELWVSLGGKQEEVEAVKLLAMAIVEETARVWEQAPVSMIRSCDAAKAYTRSSLASLLAYT